LYSAGQLSSTSESALQLSTVHEPPLNKLKVLCSSRLSQNQRPQLRLQAVILGNLRLRWLLRFRRNFFEKSIPIGASPEKAPSSTKRLVKKFKEKGVLITVEKQRRLHEKRPEKKKQSKEHVNMLDGQRLF
jgi:hypothetical protein